MFQTDINIFLQSFSSEPLTLIMKSITAIGFEEFFFIFLISIASGVNFRKGFLLMQILMLTGLVNQFLKEWFALPRPWFVDSNLDTFGKNLTTSFTSKGAMSFWELLPLDVIDQYRHLKPDTFGLPSGHTSTAITMWGSVAILFKKKWIQLICFSLIILIPLSRLYLGRHFLADVIAGYALGAIFLSIFYLIIYRKEKLIEFLNVSTFSESRKSTIFIKYIYLILFPVMAGFFSPLETKELAGFLLGLNAAYILINHTKYSDDYDSIKERLFRVLLTLIIFAIIGTVTIAVIDISWDDDLPLALFLRGFTIIFLGISISNYVHHKLKLYNK